MKAVRNYVKRSSVSRQRRESAQRQEPVALDDDRGINAKALFALMLSLEKENVAPHIKLYTFTQNYRVRDGVRAHLLKGATMLHISDAGLSRKVVGYVHGIGELAVESRMLQIKERRHWTVDDVGTYILQPSIVDGRPPPYVVPKHECGKPYQGTLVMHTPATNFHNLVMGILELARREKVKPEHYYVYIEELFKPPSDPGNPYGKLIKVATTDESRHSIRKSNQNSPMASINEALVKFQTCAVFIPTFSSGRIQPLTDLKLLATLYFTALAVRHRSNFKFRVASQREKHNEFLELLANDPQASLQEMFTAEARTARTQPNFDMEALSKIIEMEALGGIEDIDNEVTKLFVDWAQEYIEADVAHCQANKAKGTDTTHLMPTSQALADNLSIRGYFNLTKGNLVAARDDLEQALDEGPSGPEVLARALCNLGRVHLLSGEFENASDVTQRSLAVMRKGASSKENPHIPLAMAIVAQTYNARSDFRDGKTLAQSAIKEARALVKNQAKNLNELLGISIALICVGEALLAQGRASDALEKFQDAKQLRIEVLGKTHIEVAQAMDYCARAYLALDNPQEALNITRSAIVLAKLYDPSSQHVYIRTLMRTFAAAREAMDDLQGASETLKVTLDLWRAAMLTDEEDDVLHPEVFQTEAQLILVGANSSGVWNPESLFFRAKQTKLFDEILGAYFRVLGKQMDFLGVGHLDVAESKLSIATLLMTVADFESAQEYLESARKVFELKRGAAHHKTIMANARLAIVLDEMGDLETAHEMYRTCLVSFNDSKDNIHEADMLNRVSALLLRQRKFDDALLAATAGLHLYTKSLDSKTELVVGEVLFTIAAASQELGRLTQAARLISESISILMEHLEPKNDKLRLAMLRSAKICMARNKFKQAKDQLLRAMDTYSREDFSSHVLCQDTAQQLAKAYQYLDENNNAVELLRRLCRETKGVNNVPAFRARIALAKVDGAPYKTRTKALQSALQISSTLSENKKRVSKRSATPIESKLAKLGSEEAVPVLEKLGAFRLLAECYVERNLGVAGCEVLAQGIEVAEREWKSDGGKSSTVNAYINLLEFLASIMEANMCHSQAISVYEQIVNIKSEAFGDLHASIIPSFVALSSCSLDVGNLRYAMKTLEQALVALKRLGNNKRKSTSSETLKPAFLPSQDECKAMCFVMHGRVLAKEMRLKDSLQKLKDGLGLQKKLYGGSSYQVAQTMFYTGETLAAMGQDDSGIAKLRETGAFLVSYRGKWEPWCYESLVQLTTLELSKSNIKQALDWLALFDQAKGYMSPHYCAQQKYLEGVILAQKEEEEAALQCLQVSIELHKQCGSSCNEEVNLLQLQNEIVSKSAALKVLLHAAQENSRSKKTLSRNYEDDEVSSSDDEGVESKRDSRRSSITTKLLSGSKRLSKSVRNRITST